MINDTTPLVAAILHDTVEDTNTTYEEIKDQFGKEIVDVVMEVTDNRSLSKLERKVLQINNAPHKSQAAKLVKLSDKLSDLMGETPQGWNQDNIYGYFVWSYKVVEGLRGTNEALEAVLDNLLMSMLSSTLL